MKAEKDNAMDRCDLCEQVRKVLFSVEGQSCKDRRRFHINIETIRLLNVQLCSSQIEQEEKKEQIVPEPSFRLFPEEKKL